MTESASSSIVVMAGGTGGHIFPALATAEELKSRGYDIHWIGTPESMEAELVPKHGFDISYVSVTGVRGKGIIARLLSPFRVAASILAAVKLLRKLNPKCVIGMGGYVTGPGGVAARILQIPLVIHEQNAVPGMTNRLLAKIANRVLEAFPNTFAGKVAASKVTCTGNPVRSAISAAGLSPDTDGMKLLILGGSRGALAINELVPEALSFCAEDNIEVWHQCGKGWDEKTSERYRKFAVSGRVEAFIDDMAAAYEWADLIVCRAGALTVSELANAGRPAILVPFPYAVDDHQTRNGNYLVQSGAARLFQQSDLTAELLAEELKTLAADRNQLQDMSKAALACARPDATGQVVAQCLEVING
ncbi:undecaprenyldiphospho-muramoylpentapeptide beta-N-acetylglucosaminyltransferase [Spongorhabdus nitratireducens]